MSEREKSLKEIFEKLKNDNPEISEALKLLNISFSEYFNHYSSDELGIASSGDSSQKIS